MADGVDFARASLSHQRSDRLGRIAAAQDQALATRRKVLRQCRQAVMQPPARCATQLAWTGTRIVEHINHDHRPGRRRGGKRGVVGEPQIASQPYDERGGYGDFLWHRLALSTP